MTGQHLLGTGQPIGVGVEAKPDLARARSLAEAAAVAQGFDHSQSQRVALVVSEIASNLLQHSRSGHIFVRLLESGDRRGVELVATDQGPGMGMGVGQASGAASHPTDSLPPARFAAIARASDLFDLYCAPGLGTVMMSRLWGGSPTVAGDRGFRIGSMIDPFPGEVISGDAWAVEQSGTRIVAMVADGLGHGVHAAAASAAAVETLRERHLEPVEDIAAHIHRALRGTRGAAIAVAEIDSAAGRIRFCGIGNIVARLLVAGAERNLISHFGIAGYQARRIRAFEGVWGDDAILVMHSDGLLPTWDLSVYRGILRHHPQLTAATVMRDAPRVVDDALVLTLQDGNEDGDSKDRYSQDSDSEDTLNEDSDRYPSASRAGAR